MLKIEKLNPIFKEIYANDAKVLEARRKRFEKLILDFKKKFNQEEIHLFSSPGRTEISGNHTDHNHGRVLAASINLDSIAVAAKSDSKEVVLYSEGYPGPIKADLNKLKPVKKEKETTSALIRGIADRFKQLGYNIGGFNASMTSSVLPGSGLSSSASVEVLIAMVFNALYNDSKIPPEILAKIGQYAENVHFGKPCGLMDQTACAVGGIITIDFKNPEKAKVKKVDFDFNKQGYSLLVVDTGTHHADLTHEYASIPAEMKSIAKTFKVDVMRGVTRKDLLSRIPRLRKQKGDRAVLRALHFIHENDRVMEQVKALESGNFDKFLTLVTESGNSSFKWLQNIYSNTNVQEQGMTLALALTESFLNKLQAGACRVHGGGFSGTILVFLPKKAVGEYNKIITSVFGDNSVLDLNIRSHGVLYLNPFIKK
jgi:galactokinase